MTAEKQTHSVDFYHEARANCLLFYGLFIPPRQ